MHHPQAPFDSLDGFRDINPMKLYLPGAVVNGMAMENDGEGVRVYFDDFRFYTP